MVNRSLSDRRSFLRVCLSGSLGVWLTSHIEDPAEAAESNDDRAMILLWMNGGASQIDTFDLKPGTNNGGSFRPIATNTPGIEICEHLPNLAKQMQHVSLIRSMVTKEGSHERGRYLMHTGYLPVGTTKHPTFGSIISSEQGASKTSLPNFVSVALPSQDAGFLGMTHAAFHVPNPEFGVPNSTPGVGVEPPRFNRRLNMLGKMEQSFAYKTKNQQAADHLEVYQKSVRLMRSKTLSAFDVSKERAAVQAAYGQNPFGQACLLARRLIEVGVKCVEISLSNWDTHRNNETRNKELMGMLDPAMAALINELSERGRLASTLVTCMSEFGRTPKHNPLGGRDHWPNGWSVALAGAGIQGGKVIGKTNRDGTEVADRPVPVPDLFATYCKALRIDHDKENYTPFGRPVPIVNNGTPVQELF